MALAIRPPIEAADRGIAREPFFVNSFVLSGVLVSTTQSSNRVKQTIRASINVIRPCPPLPPKSMFRCTKAKNEQRQ